MSEIIELTLVGDVVGNTSLDSTVSSSGEPIGARLTRYWNAYPVHFKAGNVLALNYQGKMLAEHIAAGKAFRLSQITLQGVKLPLREGFILSLDTLKTVWGCPACHSAHGTNIGASARKGGRPNPVTLANSNPFLYNPVTRELFTMSDTCRRKYITDLGFYLTDARRFRDLSPASYAEYLKETEPAIETPATVVPTPATKSNGKEVRK